MSFFTRIIFGKPEKAHEPRKISHVVRENPVLQVAEDGPRTAVWAVGGGKGGVGKSFVAANVGVSLATRGKRVLVVDADLGAANMHTFLGVDNTRSTLSNFLKSEDRDIRPYVSKTGIPNLDLVSGAKDSLTVADQRPESVVRLKAALLNSGYDYAILDIGPGTSANNLDLFLVGGTGVLVTTPEPTSIENTYRFLKCLFLRRIRNISHSQEDSRLKDTLNRIFAGPWAQQIKTVSDILMRLKELDPERGEMLKALMGDTTVSIVVNQVKRPSDGNIGPSMKKACKDYFGLEIGFLGDILFEEFAAESVRSRKPLVITHGNSQASKAIAGCVERLLGEENRTKTGKALNFSW
jgi:flagellar biosynthesis protein FlhG